MRTILISIVCSSWQGKPLPNLDFQGKHDFRFWQQTWINSIEVSFWKAPLCLVAPCGAFMLEKWRFLDFLDMSIFKKWAFLEIWLFFQGRLPRPNHYVHDVRSEILSRTPVSILQYLSPRPQNLRKTSNNSFLAWMSTWISKWRRRRRRRRRRFPKNHHAQEPNIPFGESLTSTNRPQEGIRVRI